MNFAGLSPVDRIRVSESRAQPHLCLRGGISNPVHAREALSGVPISPQVSMVVSTVTR